MDLGNATFREGDEDVSIDGALLHRRRGESPGAVDLAIVNQSFGADYRAAMGELITQRLWALMSHANGDTALNRMAVRERVASAIKKALEAA